MCGRYTLRNPAAAARALLGPGMEMAWDEWRPRYNVAPSQSMPVICRGPRGGRQIEPALMRWGITLRWGNGEKRRLFINVRSESAGQKPAFRSGLRDRRCIIPADGFFEWKRPAGGGAKAEGRPYFVRRRDDKPIWLAGFFESQAGGDDAPAYAILTTAPNALMASIHDRMPVILSEDSARAWLAPDEIGVNAMAGLCAPWPPDDLVATSVGPAVNDTGNDHAGCIAPPSGAESGEVQSMLSLD